MQNANDFSVEFRDWGELRQGSSHNTFSITIKGRWKPDLKTHDLPVSPEHGWSNLHAASEGGRLHALVVWNLENNTPGFQVVMFDTVRRAITLSERFSGLPENLQWKNMVFEVSSLNIVVPK